MGSPGCPTHFADRNMGFPGGVPAELAQAPDGGGKVEGGSGEGFYEVLHRET